MKPGSACHALLIALSKLGQPSTLAQILAATDGNVKGRASGLNLGQLRRYNAVKRTPPDEECNKWRWELTDKGRELVVTPEGPPPAKVRLREVSGFDHERYQAEHERHIQRQVVMGLSEAMIEERWDSYTSDTEPQGKDSRAKDLCKRGHPIDWIGNNRACKTCIRNRIRKKASA